MRLSVSPAPYSVNPTSWTRPSLLMRRCIRINRQEKIVELCRNKIVLHLGFVQHRVWESRLNQGRWLHEKINQVAKRTVGLDILREEVIKIRTHLGYECYCANVEAFESNFLNTSFDVIVCGELIEHLSNPGLMIEGIKHFMHGDSIVIITTPNPYSQQRISLIQKDKLERHWLNNEHSMWFTFQTLKQLLKRHGFAEVDYTFYDIPRKKIQNLRDLLREIRSGRSRERLSEWKGFYYNRDGLFFVARLGSGSIHIADPSKDKP